MRMPVSDDLRRNSEVVASALSIGYAMKVTMTSRHIWIALLAAACAGGRFSAQEVRGSAVGDEEQSIKQIIEHLTPQPREANSTVSQSRTAGDATPLRSGVPTAAVDLDPAVIGTLPGDPLPRLRREGEFVVERSGRLKHLESLSTWVIIFQPTPGEPDLRPMILQRCQRLASMQDTLDPDTSEQGGMIFTITGQVHTYRGVNYLLPTRIAGTRQVDAEVSPPADRDAEAGLTSQEPAASPPVATSFDADFGEVTADSNEQPPATFDAADGGGTDAIELMEQMLETRQSAPSRPDSAPVVAQTDAKLDAALQGLRNDPSKPHALRSEGDYLISRAGRLTRGISGMVGGEAQNVLFTFEADGSQSEASEAPMMIMPCKLLEQMEQLVSERGDATVFVVSGRVHQYRGANYLLPTTMRVAMPAENVGR